MKRDEYTYDAICGAMGVGAFVEAGGAVPVLRLLLMPSFDPEVCITVREGAADGTVSVVALTEMLWRQASPRVLPAVREEAALPCAVCVGVVALAHAALIEARTTVDRSVWLDGMPVACAVAGNGGPEVFGGQPSGPALRELVARVLRAAWEACADASVRNALSVCARYVDMDLPETPLPEGPAVVRILVLGTEDARESMREERGASDATAGGPRHGNE